MDSWFRLENSRNIFPVNYFQTHGMVVCSRRMRKSKKLVVVSRQRTKQTKMENQCAISKEEKRERDKASY
jgi:hypothetical protein